MSNLRLHQRRTHFNSCRWQNTACDRFYIIVGIAHGCTRPSEDLSTTHSWDRQSPVSAARLRGTTSIEWGRQWIEKLSVAAEKPLPAFQDVTSMASSSFQDNNTSLLTHGWGRKGWTGVLSVAFLSLHPRGILPWLHWGPSLEQPSLHPICPYSSMASVTLRDLTLIDDAMVNMCVRNFSCSSYSDGSAVAVSLASELYTLIGCSCISKWRDSLRADQNKSTVLL